VAVPLPRLPRRRRGGEQAKQGPATQHDAAGAGAVPGPVVVPVPVAGDDDGAAAPAPVSDGRDERGFRPGPVGVAGGVEPAGIHRRGAQDGDAGVRGQQLPRRGGVRPGLPRRRRRGRQAGAPRAADRRQAVGPRGHAGTQGVAVRGHLPRPAPPPEPRQARRVLQRGGAPVAGV